MYATFFDSDLLVDMQVEQSALVKNVYPKLREFFRRRCGIDFHVRF